MDWPLGGSIIGVVVRVDGGRIDGIGVSTLGDAAGCVGNAMGSVGK